MTQGWPRNAQDAARRMAAQYGPPDRAYDDHWVWDGRYPFKRVVVRGTGRSPLESVVTYPVPVVRQRELSRFPHGLGFNAVKEELSARSDDDKVNLLVLNLGSEIASGRLDAAQAEERFSKAVDLSMSGKSQPEMERLEFAVPYRGSSEADNPY
jgi:hypothetical protein